MLYNCVIENDFKKRNHGKYFSSGKLNNVHILEERWYLNLIKYVILIKEKILGTIH